MNMDEDSMEQISLKKKQILGSYSWQGNMDMFNNSNDWSCKRTSKE